MAAKCWDYVVIGAGAAGCVVAGRLARKVLRWSLGALDLKAVCAKVEAHTIGTIDTIPVMKDRG